MIRFFFLLLFAVSTLSAQNRPSSVWIGGSVSSSYYSGRNSDGDKTKLSELTLSPFMKYFMTENWAIGIKTTFVTWKQSFSNATGNDSYGLTEYGLFPFVDYYGAMNDHFGYNFQFDAGYRWDDDNRKFISLSARPGLFWLINDKWALEGSLGGAEYEHGERGDVKENKFTLALNLTSISFGIRYCIK
ncbi:outer membrane beta-barrel protein [bacterium]|nr:outer membrane beta-barrel protein [bacterium]